MRHRSTALPLALAFVALVVYASLYPFVGWRWPDGADALDLLALPWPPWRDRADEVLNFAGYLPLGALLFGATLRSGARVRSALCLAVGVSALLSAAVEVTQGLLPHRVPSLRDCGFNVAGAVAGALLAWALFALGWVDRWHALRERWFARESAFALGLVLLWPFALLFPAPVPLGLGAVWGELADAVAAALEGTPWVDEAQAWMGDLQSMQVPLTRLRVAAIAALGLLAPMLVAFATSRTGWHRIAMVLGVAGMALGMLTLSAAMNFGPLHALTWWSDTTAPAFAVAVAAGLLLSGSSPRLAAALGLLALAVLVALVAQAPASPYYAATLQSWEQGRFIRFHGLAQWFGWLWPYAAIGWLVWRLARREWE